MLFRSIPQTSLVRPALPMVEHAPVVVAATQPPRPASTPPQDSIPVRRVILTAESDSGVLGAVLGVRPLADGRALVNDFGMHRLLMFESNMKTFTIVADTVA